MSRSIPTTGDEITPAWLAEVPALRTGDAPPEVVGVERIGEAFGFSSELFRVTLNGGAPSTIVVKLWSTDGPAGVREVSFYSTIGDDAGLRVPRCFHGAIDGERRRGVLVLEDIRDGVQGDCLDTLPPEHAARLAREIASLHARWWESERLDQEWLPSVATLTREPGWFRSRGEEFRRRFRDELTPECGSLFEAARATNDHANALLAAFPETLIHADFHLDNLIFEGDGDPVFLDWARVARGPAVLDLLDIMLTTHASSGPEIVGEYLDALRSPGVRMDAERLTRAVSGAMLRRFLAWTYGVVRWQTSTDREERIRSGFLRRGQAALIAWREHDPDGFVFASD